jgi:methionyl-tRNA formyltransferase
MCTLPESKSQRHSDFVDLGSLAASHDVPVIRAANSNAPEVLDQLRALELDYVFVIGWSQICKPAFLQLPSRGAIGYHPAPLPENRGRAVIPWTILQGRTETGATLFWMDEGIDSGDVLVQRRFPMTPDETAATLYQKHLDVLELMLDEAIPQLKQGTASRTPQDHRLATYCAKRTPADGLVDWSQSAAYIARFIRAVGDPYPGAFSFYRGRKLVIWEADFVGDAPYCGLPGQVQQFSEGGALVQCGDGKHVRLTTVQHDDGPRIPAHRVLKMHAKLGIDLIEMVMQTKKGNGP